MRKVNFIIFLSFFFSINIQAEENELIAFSAVDKLFLAISKYDHKMMRESVIDTFVLLEHGEVWSIQDLIDVVNPSEYVRTNYFSIINSDVRKNIAHINYWNKANFNNIKNNQDVIWLESVVVHKIDGIWRLSQMHSTRLADDKKPKNIQFKKQNLQQHID